MPSISRASEQFIIASEVTSEAEYRKSYHWATWPGGRSGITVGIGYDLGMTDAASIRRDWGPHVSPAMLEVMVRCAGVSGAAAQRLLPSVKRKIDIPWDAAISVFERVDMPKWTNIVLKALPNARLLPPDCLGVLVSLTYNRGASYSKVRDKKDKLDRYREMREIKRLCATKEFEKIPAQLRSMSRLWSNKSERGLPIRREAEAKLFEKGLRSQMTDVSAQSRIPVSTVTEEPDEPEEITDTGDDRHVDVDEGDAVSDPSVTHEVPQSSTLIRAVKIDLDSFGYHEFGELNGEWGGRTVGAISAFKLDTGLSGPATIDQELLAEIEKRKAMKWSRPMADSRALATTADLAPTSSTIQATGQNKVIAWILGVPAMAGAFFKGILEKFSDATSYLQPVKDFLGDVPGEVWFVGLVAIAGGLWYTANKAEKSTTEDYKSGKLLQ